MNRTGIIILAAGNSSRLGRPKQLLPYRGGTLLSHIVAESLAASLQPVLVITGAYDADIQHSLKDQAVDIVYNPAWETGMASGIVAGLDKALSMTPHLQSIIVSVCDQPYISAGLFRELIAAYSSAGKGLIASGYSGIAGTPVLFDHRYFKELSNLSGDAGARQLLKKYPDDLSIVPFPKGDIDIDTEDDLHQLPVSITSLLKEGSQYAVKGTLWIECEEERFFGPGRVELLQRIDQTGSIRQAAADMGMSYKKAWQMIAAVNKQATRPLVVPKVGGEKGGGSVITDDARELIAFHARLRERFLAFLREETDKLKK